MANAQVFKKKSVDWSSYEGTARTYIKLHLPLVFWQVFGKTSFYCLYVMASERMSRRKHFFVTDQLKSLH